MTTRSQKIRLGIFIAGAAVILLATLSVLFLQKFLKEKDTYYIAYKNLSLTGLNVGSSVKYLGINVGTVNNIVIDPEDISRVIVTINLKAGTPIKKDVIADITTLGITGIKIIELRGGTNEADLLTPGEFIRAGSSLTEDITFKAEQIANKIDILLVNLLELTGDQNREKFNALMDNLHKSSQTTSELLAQNRQHIDNTLTNVDEISADMVVLTRDSKRTMKIISDIVESDTFKTAVVNLAQFSEKINNTDIDKLIEELNQTVHRTNRLLTQTELVLRENRDHLNLAMQEMAEAIEYLNSAARQIDEDPSVLIGGSKPDNPPDEGLE